MKSFLKWAAIVVVAILSLAMFSGANEVTQYFVVLFWIVGYCYFALSKQIRENHEAVVRRLNVLHGLARGSAELHDDE